METINNELQMADLFQIVGILILGYVVLMGIILLLFKMLFPGIQVKESPLVIRRLAIMNRNVQRKTTRIRKMRLANE